MASRQVTLLRREAEAKALRARRELGVPLDEPIDVYDAIRKLRLWLLFEPLDGLFGMYQRQGSAAGIVISVKVHPALQRYTAAHELGHHLMGHDLGMDPEKHIIQWLKLDRTELAAQMFAAEFLMPLASVNSAASSLGVDRKRVTPLEVYQLSLRLRASYSAMITRLQTLEWFDGHTAGRLRRVQPKELKRTLLGRPPAVSGADVWLVTSAAAKHSFSPLVGDEVLFALEENPSSGYRWNAELPHWLPVSTDEFVEPARVEDAIGGVGVRRLQVSVEEPGTSSARLVLRREWETSKEIAEIAVSVDAELRPVSGVDLRQKRALLAGPVTR